MSSLTYALISDFEQAKDIGNTGGIVEDMNLKDNRTQINDEKIRDYLRHATRYIETYTRRSFFPSRQVREYPIPNSFFDLSRRRLPFAELIVDADLIAINEIKNGEQLLTDKDYYLLPLNTKPHYAVGLKFPKAWGGGWGYSYPYAARVNEGVIKIDGIWGYAESRPSRSYPHDFWIKINGSLNANIDAVTRQIAFTVPPDAIFDNWGERAFLEGRLIKMGDEFMQVTGVDKTKVTVIRGVNGTIATSHLSTTEIHRWNVVEDIVQACLQVAKTWREAVLQTGGRLGVSDMSVGVEMGIPADVLTIIKSYQRSMILE